MHILHLVNDIKQTGNGIVHVAVDLACMQAAAGHEVGVASAGGAYSALLSRYNVQHFELDQRRDLTHLTRICKRYQEIIRDFEPDIIHAHMITGALLARILRRQSGYSLVCTIHNEHEHKAILMAVGDRVIAVSQAVADSMRRRGIPQSKLRVVLNGTVGSPRMKSISNVTSVCLNRPAITCVAGMYRRKGIGELIDAFARVSPAFPNAHLYLIGDGPDRALFEAQALGTSVHKKIHFEGFRLEPTAYLLSTDIFVLASRKEPYALVLSEAREAGCAIVASNVGGIPEALDGGRAGLLVPPADPATLATTLMQLLSDPHLRREWKLRSQTNLEQIGIARVNEETLAVYHELTRAQ